MNTLMIVSLLVLGTFTIVNSLVIKMLLNENRDMHSAITKDNSKDLDERVNRLSKQIKPIVTEKYKKNKVEAWKQFNLWKYKLQIKNDMSSGNEVVCGDCLNDSLEIVVKYQNGRECTGYIVDNQYEVPKVNYPIYAKCVCKTCGHVVKKWKYERDEFTTDIGGE